ncbi:MAG: formate dehydrogenase accessory sulfurtransferase FdhD [Rhodoferax sp.]|uniref:formate dehydrogenase accessory sulfurtransferase FdhD n=1 Tax=Rhodoferax sp. TaxID=50421 RepID=UPI001B6F76C2|nr:formate dehydrogenase accessory sulfurtransferase FdhD [Rhodoferax sp.]MBP9907150.1 formate dehydrogenase accessory sulfurtransferase FdhD [Rhodoferax sp.]
MDMSVKPMPAELSYRCVEVVGLRAGQRLYGQDHVAEEAAVALEFNGISHAVMLATPVELEDFACGFALTEGIVDSLAQVLDCDVSASAQGYTVHLRIAAGCFARLKDQRRNLTGRTGCGLCGTESLAHALRPVRPLAPRCSFTATALRCAEASLRGRQGLLSVTGATHAAAWCSAIGQIALLREDVGRHNALDKLIGALLRSKTDPSRGFVVVTSRASVEMVQKAAAAGIGLLAAVSGVTGLAVDVAQHSGLTLAGFVRGENVSIYSHPQRFELN